MCFVEWCDLVAELALDFAVGGHFEAVSSAEFVTSETCLLASSPLPRLTSCMSEVR